MILSEPVAQLPVAADDAVIVAVPPVALNVAVLPEKLTTEVSLELHVVKLVTSELLSAAANVAVVLTPNVGPAGLEVIVSVCALPPVVLPVIDP